MAWLQSALPLFVCFLFCNTTCGNVFLEKPFSPRPFEIQNSFWEEQNNTTMSEIHFRENVLKSWSEQNKNKAEDHGGGRSGCSQKREACTMPFIWSGCCCLHRDVTQLNPICSKVGPSYKKGNDDNEQMAVTSPTYLLDMFWICSPIMQRKRS